MKKICVIGGRGVIGSAIVKRLETRGASVGTNPLEKDIDGLVCAYGMPPPKDFLNSQPYDIINEVTTMLSGPLLDVANFCAHHEKGRIALFAGGGVGGNAEPGYAVYKACKAGIVQFVEILALEAPQFRINAIAPGPVKSPMSADQERDDWVSPDLAAEMVTRLMLDEDTVRITGRLLSARFDWLDSPLTQDQLKLRRVEREIKLVGQTP